MEFRSLDITLISCENLTCIYTRKPIKKNALGIIRLPHNNNHVYSTSLDRDNGSYPHWNEKFRVQIPLSARWFEIEIRRGMESVIGWVKVPVSDFVNQIVPIGYLNCLSYRLRGQNGEFVDGIVNVSVRVTNLISKGDRGGGEICLGVPLVRDQGKEGGGCTTTGSCSYGVVTGVPVSYGVKN